MNYIRQLHFFPELILQSLHCGEIRILNFTTPLFCNSSSPRKEIQSPLGRKSRSAGCCWNVESQHHPGCILMTHWVLICLANAAGYEQPQDQQVLLIWSSLDAEATKLLSGSAEFQPAISITWTGQVQTQWLSQSQTITIGEFKQLSRDNYFHGVPLINSPQPHCIVSKCWGFSALPSLHVSCYLLFLSCAIHAVTSVSFTENYQTASQTPVHHFCRIPAFPANQGTQQVKDAVNHWDITDQN